jgi:DNA-binding beta-propeller fold protein YncE
VELQQDIGSVQQVKRRPKGGEGGTGYRNLILVLAVVLGVLVLFYFLINRPARPVEKAPTLGFEHLFSIYGHRADRLARPTETAVDSSGNIYVADTNNHRIVVFDSKGGYLRHFGRTGDGPGEIKHPSGIAVDKQKNVYVLSRRQNKLMIFNPKGEVTWEVFVEAPLTLRVVDDRLYLATDRGIMIGTTKGELLSNFGKKGSAKGDLDHPTGLVVDEKGIVYVADSMNYRVQAFDKDGKSIWAVGTRPKHEDGELRDKDRTFGLPAGLAMGDDGNLYLVDAQTGEIVVLTRKGEQLAKFGDWGYDDGQFYYPAGITYMGEDKFAVADKFNDRVQVIRYTTRQPIANRFPGGLPIIILVILLMTAGAGTGGRWYWRQRRLRKLAEQPPLGSSDDGLAGLS